MNPIRKMILVFSALITILGCTSSQTEVIEPSTKTVTPTLTLFPESQTPASIVQDVCSLKFQESLDSENLNDVAWSSQEDMIAIALDYDVLLYESPFLQFKENIGFGGTEVAFSPDGIFLAIGKDAEIVFWNISEKRIISKIKVDMEKINHIVYNSMGTSLAILGDTRITEGDPNSVLELWDVQNLRKIYTNRDTWEANIAFSPNGEKLAFISNAGLVLIQSATGEQQKVDLTWEGGSLAFIDEDTLIKRLDYDRLSIIKIKTLETLKIINVQGSYSEFVISPDRKTLVFPNIWDTTQVWDVENGKLLYELNYRSDAPRVDFSPDSKYFISADYEGCIRVHDLETGEVIN